MKTRWISIRFSPQLKRLICRAGERFGVPPQILFRRAFAMRDKVQPELGPGAPDRIPHQGMPFTIWKPDELMPDSWNAKEFRRILWWYLTEILNMKVE